MRPTSKVSRTAVFAVVFFGALLHAQVPAGPNRPSEVPDNYVITPNGYFHPSCVRELKKGETLLADRHAIQHVDGSIEIVPACQYPHYTAHGEIITGAEPPTVSGWVEYASTTTSASFGELAANWVVPPAPASNDSQIVYFFPGMEDTNDIISILQPVLQYGANGSFGGNYWVIASWNCCVSGTTYHSSPINVNPGDLLLGTIRSTCSPGVLSCATWNITTEDETLGKSTTLNNSSADGQTFNWAFAGALEVYYVVQCSDYPPNGAINYYGLALYDYNFNQISSPGWSITNLSSGFTPQCNYGGQVDTSTQVTLDYGTFAQPPSAVAGPAAFSDATGAHAFYLGTNQHVYQLYFSSSTHTWTNSDLTAMTGNTLAASGSALAGFSDSFGEHAFYLGTNQHVYQLYFSFSTDTWANYDLTAMTGNTLAASGSALAGFSDSFGEHAFYLGTNQHVYQLYFSSSTDTWANQDLTAVTGDTLAASGSKLAGFSDSSGEHAFYLGTNQQVFQLYWTSTTGWQNQDLSALSE